MIDRHTIAKMKEKWKIGIKKRTWPRGQSALECRPSIKYRKDQSIIGNLELTDLELPEAILAKA